MQSVGTHASNLQMFGLQGPYMETWRRCHFLDNRKHFLDNRKQKYQYQRWRSRKVSA